MIEIRQLPPDVARRIIQKHKREKWETERHEMDLPYKVIVGLGHDELSLESLLQDEKISGIIYRQIVYPNEFIHQTQVQLTNIYAKERSGALHIAETLNETIVSTIRSNMDESSPVVITMERVKTDDGMLEFDNPIYLVPRAKPILDITIAEWDSQAGRRGKWVRSEKLYSDTFVYGMLPTVPKS